MFKVRPVGLQFARRACARGLYVKDIDVAGTGVATKVSVTPTATARLGGQDKTTFDAMFQEMERCGPLPPMTSAARSSVYKQMACHLVYRGVRSGPRWDLESWRKDVSWFEALKPSAVCNYDFVPDADAGKEFAGHIVQSSDDGSAQKRAWLVGLQRGAYVRRHIPSARTYYCLKNSGAPGPDVLPDEFTNHFLIPVGEVPETVCPPEQGTGGPGTTPQPQPQPQPPPTAARVNAYDNYGPANAGRAMCRGNPARPESMPGGTASQSFTVPAGVASIDAAKVQIDPDPRVAAHATLSLNGGTRATADASAAGDTNFTFPSVAVSPGDQVTLSINFTATYGKIITVYTAGAPGGVFTASNSCPDGAPSLSTAATGLRAVLSGWNR
jgi:hypothetical protein